MKDPMLANFRPSPSGWLADITLPAFRTCYEKWDLQGNELRDTRDDERKQGHFSALLLFPDGRCFERSDKRFRPGGKIDDLIPPTHEQIAALEYLTQNQATVAHELFTALAREAPGIFPGLEELPEKLQNTISTTEGIMQTVEFDGPFIGLQSEDGCALVGFPFHSDLLDAEHGVAILMHRNRVVEIGQQDILL